MRPLVRAGIVLAAVAFTAVTATAQAPQTPAPAATPPQGTTAQAPAQPAAPAQAKPGEVYSYDPDGRRDPFVSLLVRGDEFGGGVGRENRPDGRDGLMIGEISVRGIVRTRNSYMAMVTGPDNKTYIIHPGDKVLDGVVKAILAEAVVFAQDVNDPLSLVKQREVRKTLRAAEEGK